MRKHDFAVVGLQMLTGALDSVLITGVEESPDGLRVYVGPRYEGVYVLVTDPAEQEKARRGWGMGGHVFMATPPAEALHRVAPGADREDDREDDR